MAKFVNGRVTVSVLRTMRDWKQHAQHADRAPVQLDTFRTWCAKSFLCVCPTFYLLYQNPLKDLGYMFATCQEGGLLTDRVANHFFFFAKRKGQRIGTKKIMCSWTWKFVESLSDIPANYELDEGTCRRRPPHDHDIFCLVKEYISSVSLRQRPLLVLTEECKEFFSLVTDRILDQ